ncbi:S9 family peptidase [Crossiella sp. NPDC003009]
MDGHGVELSMFEQYVPGTRYWPALAISPDGRALAHVRNTGERFDLWLWEESGQRRLTGLPERSVRRVAWSPDGRTLAFATDHNGDEQYQLHLLDLATGLQRQLTKTEGRQHILAANPFTPDGRRLLYAANDRDPLVQDLLVHELDSDVVHRVESRPGVMLRAVSASPDGRWLLARGMRGKTNTHCVLVDLSHPDLPAHAATPEDAGHVCDPGPWAADSAGFFVHTNADGQFQRLAFHHLADGRTTTTVQDPGWDVEETACSADGNTLVRTVNVDGVSRLHAERGGVPLNLPELPAGMISALALSADGSHLAFLANSPTQPTELALLNLDTGSFGYLADNRPPALAQRRPVEPELVRYPTHDGRRIPAWLYRPHGTGAFPVLLSVRGGPEAQERPAYQYSGLYQYLLANGIGVLAPNFRGSTGYGSSFQKLIHRDWGGGELGDLEHAVLFLRGLPWVRADRIGVFGASFGGFAALSCLSRLPHLGWAAGVSLVGPANLVTLTRSVPPTWRPLMAAWIGDPDTEAERLLARSPITHAERITAPLLVIQGARDPRVAKAESDQIVAALRARGVPVRYHVYPEEGHGFTKRDNEIEALSTVAEFLPHHLTDGVGSSSANGS